MKLGLALWLAAAYCLAQQPYEIRGAVSEPNVGPLAGMEVRIYQLGAPGSQSRQVATTYTSARGEYVVQFDDPGSYFVQVVSPGYTPLAIPNQATVTRDRPRAAVNASLVRLGQIIGRVLDAETLKPIPGITVVPMRRDGSRQTSYRWTAAPPVLPSDGRFASDAGSRDVTKSGEDGTFTLRDRMPGDYSVTTVPEGLPVGSPFLLGASLEDLKVYEEVYRPLHWPGGVPASEAVPLTLTSGGSLNVGNILLKKTPVYRAMVSVPRGVCPEGESVRLSLITKADVKTQVVPCGSDVLIKGLFPGTYALYAVSDWQGERDQVENAVWARDSLFVRDKNPLQILNLRRGVVLDVRVTAAQGGPQIPDSLRFSFQPDPQGTGLPYPDREQFWSSTPEGHLRLAVGPGQQRLISTGLRDAYVSEVRYNGAPYADPKLSFNASLPNQTFEVILDNKFATVQGEIADAAGAVIVFFQPDWIPPSASLNYPLIYSVNAVASRYVSNPLPPGRYRVMALPIERFVVADGARLIVPDDAPRITLRPGANETLNVRLTPASR